MLPEVPPHALAALRVCQRCGALGRVNSQGVVVAETSTEIKGRIEDNKTRKGAGA